MSARTRTLLLTIAGAVVFVLAIGLWISQWIGHHQSPGMATHDSPVTVQIGGPFALTGANGATVRDSDFRGRLMLIFFGYTFCPDVCPTSLQTVADALAQLDPATAQQVQPIFISVDPARDTPQVLAEYTAAFDKRIMGLTGTAEQVAQVARAYKVFYRRSPAPAGADAKAYTIDHTAILYLMGREGAYAAHFTHDASPDQVVTGIRRALGQTPR